MELRQVEKISKALSDHNRLKILKYMQENKGAMACMEIANILSLAQPSISHHIKKLVDAEVIIPQKDGRYYRYTINSVIWDQYINSLKNL